MDPRDLGGQKHRFQCFQLVGIFELRFSSSIAYWELQSVVRLQLAGVEGLSGMLEPTVQHAVLLSASLQVV